MNSADFGTVSVSPSRHPGLESAGYSHVETCRWRPRGAVAADLPPNFSFELQSAQRPDGERVFFPGRSGGATLLEGCLGGLALLSHVQELSPQQRQSYRVMHFLFQAVQTRREFQRRRFQYSRDLYVRQSSREDIDERTVLPPDLGLTPDGPGRPWSITELREQGQAVAAAAGVVRPTTPQLISWGLLAAAQRHPLTISEGDVPRLLRAALFSSGSPLHDAETRQQIEQRILTAIQRHLQDASNQEFMNWLCGAKSSFVKQIAHQRSSPGGLFPLQTVRDVLLELGWQSYQYMADCLQLQAWAFSRALEPRLTVSEQRRFDLLYAKQPAFGQLPLLLIRERIPEIRPAVARLLETGDDAFIPVLHRLLNYYQFMARERRESDCRGQQHHRLSRPGRSALSFREELGVETWRVQDHREAD